MKLRPGRTFLPALVVVGLVSACSSEPSDSRDERTVERYLKVEEADWQPAEAGEAAAVGDGKNAQPVFKLYEEHVLPLVQTNCATCHADATTPFFAADDPVAAYNAVSEAGKIDLANPANSRLVVRLRTDNHNCWGNCTENGAEIEQAIQAMAAAAATGDGEEDATGVIKTATRGLAELQTVKIPAPDYPGIIAFEAESGQKSAGYEDLADQDASDGIFVTAASGGVALPIPPPASRESANHETLSFDFEVKFTGFYVFWGRVRGAGDDNNSVYYRIDDGPLKQWDFNPANSGDFRWDQVSNAGEGDELLELDVGVHNITFHMAEVDLDFDKFVITNNIIGDLDEIEVPSINANALFFSLDDILGVNDVQIAISITDLDESAYLVRSPTLINPGGYNIKIRGIYPLVNDDFASENATWSLVDTTTTETIEKLSDANSTVLKVDGSATDVFSIRFDELQILPP